MAALSVQFLLLTTTILLLRTVVMQNNPTLPFVESIIQFFHQGLSRYDEAHITDTQGLNLLHAYDFVIVGGGAAGSVLASRLSENAAWRVLLLEAGKDETFMTDIPMFRNNFQTIADFNWKYQTAPQENACLGMTKHRCNWPHGKALGGSSTINDMVYTRGHRKDYDEWAELGNTGWGYSDIFPYFIKSENNRIPELKESVYHGRNGDLNVESVPFRTPLAKAFLEAGEILGYNLTDYNGAQQEGFSYVQVNMRNGTRCSASKAFLRPARERPNLHVSLNSHVTKIVIDPTTKRATGVQFMKNGVQYTYTIQARNEVILSAGTLHSPQILMLSGIGPKEHLEKLEIPVIQDLKVGYNLQEHVGFTGPLFFVNESTAIVERRLTYNPANALDYFLRGQGALTVPGGVEALAFVKTALAQDERPDVELLYLSMGVNSDGGGQIKEMYGITDELYNSMYRTIDNLDVWSVIVFPLKPKSRGVIKLLDKNPYTQPFFEANFFSDPSDIKQLVEGIKVVLKLAETPAFQKYGSSLHTTPVPACRHIKFSSEEYWSCAAKYLTAPMNHQVGTCKMGPASDADAVVDPELKVHGIDRLRVVDASIMPVIPSAHTNAATYMIAEKAADLIKRTSW